MIRVAFECTNFRRGEVGGYEGFLLNLLDGLYETHPEDMEITLFVLSDQRQYFKEYVSRFKIRDVSARGTIIRILWQNLVLPFYSLFFDVVVSTANVRPWILFSKSITVIHDLQYRFFPEYWPRGMLLYRKLLVPISIRRSDRVATISDTVREEIRREFGRQDIDVCYQAIAINPPPDCEPLAGIPEPFFLVPSILFPHKNIKNLAIACSQFDRKESLPFFIFIGAYAAEDFPHEIPADRGRVLGYVDRGLRDHLLARCAAMILPSLYDGFGMPYAEALLAGKPVIACDIPIAREVLGDDATFIQSPFGSVEITAAIERFLQHGQKPLSREVVERLEERTQPQKVADRYLKLIRELIRHNG